MSQEVPKTIKQWTVSKASSFRDALKFAEVNLPELGDSQVLVKFHAASLNFRDLIIAKGQYPFPMASSIVPGSDGAGTIIAVGKNVTRFKTGDKVVTLFNQKHQGGPLDAYALGTGVGGAIDGTLRTHGAFPEDAVVALPQGLSFLEGATLPCAALTAWNALYGLADHRLQPGQWVLTQGTGGVSIFGVQFAKAAGARVIATTSSPEKAKLLEKLGADHIINYKDTPNWGEKAREFTGGVGVDHVIEVAGDSSMAQSLKSVKIEGVISIIGFVGGRGDEEKPSFVQCLSQMCIARGLLVGSRAQMEDMCRAIEANVEKLRPIVDPQVFKLDKLVDAYEYQWSGKHQAKVCIEID